MAKPPKISELFTIDFAKISDDEITSLRIQIEKEFKRRKIKFSSGEIGEIIAIDFHNNTPGLDNLQRAPIGTKNVDALSRKGERYSIKTIKDGNKSGTVYPDKEDKNKQLFEYLLVVQLNEDYELNSLHRFSWKMFVNVRQWDSTMSAWYISRSKKVLNQGECIYEKRGTK